MNIPSQNKNSDSQLRKETRRRNKQSLERLCEQIIQLSQSIDPGSASNLLKPYGNGKLYRRLREIDSRLGIDASSRCALE
jgi:hypothetical protein